MQESPFRTRFELLLDTGQVSLAVVNVTLKVITEIENRYGRRLTEDNAAMFVTHMLMAFQRLVEHEELHEVPPEILEEVEPYTDTRLFVAETVGKELQSFDVHVPDAEIAYLTVHLVAIQQVESQA